MALRRKPQQYVNLINFETGATDSVPELPSERRSRMSREARTRRRAAFEHFDLMAERKTAVTLAWRLAYDGHALPIHFDLVLTSGSYTSIERCSLIDAAFSRHIARSDEAVGSFAAINVRRNRSASVTPHVVHSVSVSGQ